MSALIELQDLSKKFDQLLAVNSISLTLQKGEVLGLLGANGSGKTTTMRMIAGSLSLDSGIIKIDNVDISSKRVEAQLQIGYLPEGAPSYGDMTVSAYLNFIVDIRQLTTNHAKQAIAYCVERTNISHTLHQRINTLSKGYKRRVGLAQAILHNPKVLILDEPTDGLDPNQKHEIYNLIREISKDKAIIISTHILEEVQEICSRVVIINHGKIVADDTVEELNKKSVDFNQIFKQLTNNNTPTTDKKSPQPIKQQSQASSSFLQGTMAIFKREFSTYFATPIAYAIMVIFVALSGSLTFFLSGFFIQGQASLESLFQYFPWLFLFLIPAIAMRLWAEERSSGCIDLLLTLPVSTFSIVLGKFLAAWLVIAICLLLTTTLWFTVNYLGTPDNSAIAVGYMGSLLMAGGYLAISSCLSALSKNQIIAFIMSAFICFIFTASGLAIVNELFNDWATPMILQTINNLSFLEHFQTITRGVVEMRDMVFFISTIIFFLLINVITVEFAKTR